MQVRPWRMVQSLLVLVGLTAAPAVLAADASSLWPSAGQNLRNTRAQGAETQIKPLNAGSLVKAWEVDTAGDVSATPAVDGRNLYFPDAGGSLWALDRATGNVVWHKTMADYGLLAPGDYARTTPVIAGSKLIFGDQGGKFFAGASVMAVAKQTGELLWKTTVDTHFSAMVTQSAIWDESSNVVYVGVASNEEGFAAFIPGYECCTFRGSVVALNANTGAILWKTYMAPEGYSGNAVWGSTPVIDRSRQSLYVTTGNNYSVPADVSTCVAAATTPEGKAACISPDDHFDSILALDLKTGGIRWSSRAVPFDAWIVSCIAGFDVFGGAACPEPAGPDYDFGQGPMLFTVKTPGNKSRDLLGAGQKSGQYWALDPDSGAVAWVTQTGPGGTAGGLQWGSATDGRRIFTANANSDHKPWDLVPSGGVTNGGIWSALDAATGQIIWQVANTNPDPNPFGVLPPGFRAGSNAPVTVANGVVYGCSLDPEGHMYAFDAATGAPLWEFHAPDSGSCAAGPAVVQGTVYWGSGYGGFFGASGHKMRAFKLP